MLLKHMNGRHPIDDLFAHGLRDAEATPPSAVWEGVVRKRTFGYRALERLRKYWGLSALLFLFMSGAGGYWAMRDTNMDGPAAGNRGQAIMEEGAQPSAVANTTSAVQGSSTPPDQHAIRTTAFIVTAPSGADAKALRTALDPNKQSVAKNGSAGGSVRVTSPRRYADGSTNGSKETVGSEVSPALPTTRSTTKATLDTSTSVAPASMALNGPSAVQKTTVESVLASVSASTDAFEPKHIAPRLSSLTDPALMSSPTPRETPAVYVLPKAEWWIGAQVGFSNLTNAHWTGATSLSHDLNAAETWLDESDATLFGGRRWRSGFSIETGIGIARKRSRFLSTEDLPGSSTTLVDTTWSGTVSGTTTVYTWNIDSLVIGEPVAHLRYNENNTYTSLRIPIAVGYYKDWRRWSVGARCGVILTTTIGRNGYSLATASRATDPPGSANTYSRVIDLNDPSIDERFALSLSIMGAIDFGYLLTEHLTLRISSTWSRDLGSGTATVPAPVADHFGATLRLEYAFPNHVKKSR